VAETHGVHGIVLAGAYPRGSGALEALAPRPLLPVAQQPLIAYGLQWIAEGGLASATICVNAETRGVRRLLGPTAAGLNLSYLEDWTPRGAAGCVRDAGMKTDARTFVVVDGTTVPLVDVGTLVASHLDHRAVVTVVLGADERGRLRPSGVYAFDRKAFDFIPEEGFQDIKEKLVPRLYGASEEVSTFLAPGLAPRVFNAETYLSLNHWALELGLGHTSLEFRSVEEARVHGSATVAPTARLLGPILLGPRVTIGEEATLIGPVSIGEDTMVGPGAVVSRSVLWESCVVSHGAFVDRSLIADRVVVGPREAVYSAVKVSTESGTHPRQMAPWAPALSPVSLPLAGAP
jgi:NDP-sugar pyrophosphorylase family protein